LAVAFIVLFLVLPILVVIPMGFTGSESLEFPPRGFSTQWYQELIANPQWRQALLNSALVAFGTLCLSLALGVPLALGLERGRFRGRRLLSGVVILPLVVPTVITAIGIYYTWTLGWSFGPILVGGHLTGSAVGLILAHTALAMPMMVVLTSASLRTLDRNLELASAGLGASPWRTFRHVTLPLILPGIAAGSVFAFLTSWDEAVVALFLTDARFSTFPVQMFLQVREAVDPSVASAATLVIAVTTALFTFTLISRSRDA
jgi:putative spermidine/putrescine transport system permease protein